MNRRLDSLTSLRFFAALAVVADHGCQLLWAPIAPVATLGFVGVGFFFILSGFVLTWSQPEGQPARAFYRNRFARVFPLHAATWAAVVIAITGLHPASLAALGLVQAWSPHETTWFAGNGPSWTLSCEAFFYLCFPLVAAWTARTRNWQMSLAGVLGVYAVVGLGVYMILPPDQARWIGSVLPLYRLGEFVAGALLARAIQRGWRPRGGPIEASLVTVGAFLGLAAIGAGAPTNRFGPAGMVVVELLMAPAFCKLIAAAAARDADGRPWLAQRPLVRLGEWSFALYLVHQPIMRIAAQSGARGPIVLVATAALAVGVAAVAYTGFERPAERRFRNGRPVAIPVPAQV